MSLYASYMQQEQGRSLQMKSTSSKLATAIRNKEGPGVLERDRAIRQPIKNKQVRENNLGF